MDASTLAVVYARYSSHRQGEQSIEAQLTEATLCAEQRGLTIVHEYCDRAMTGKNDNREAFQQMIKDSAKGLWKYLIVWKTDRIGRNKEDIAYNKYLLKKHGVKIIYIAEHIPDTPEGIILESVIEGMAAYYEGTGVLNGAYHLDGYRSAKQDFAIRAGLIEKQRLFSDAQLLDIYQSINETFDAGCDLIQENEENLIGIQKQIEGLLPDIKDQIAALHQTDAEPVQGQSM